MIHGILSASISPDRCLKLVTVTHTTSLLLISTVNGLNCSQCPILKRKLLLRLHSRGHLPFGFPVRIISDNGVQFVSSIFTNVCHALGIKHYRTSLYHPQSNLHERVNRTIKPVLAALAHHDHNRWNTKVAQIAFAFRTAPSDLSARTLAFICSFAILVTYLSYAYLLPQPLINFLHLTISSYRRRLLKHVNFWIYLINGKLVNIINIVVRFSWSLVI